MQGRQPTQEPCAGIFKQSMGARNQVGIHRVVVSARQATQPVGIGSLESILGLLKSLKIRALVLAPTSGSLLWLVFHLCTVCAARG